MAGMTVITPTSITNTGGSASIQTDGGVIGTGGVTSISLNGVFSATYKNYYITAINETVTGGEQLEFRLRASGTDDTGNNYGWNYLSVNSTSIAVERLLSQSYFRMANTGSDKGANNNFIFSPYLAKQTVYASQNSRGSNQPRLHHNVGVHSQELSYDGITFFYATGSMDYFLVYVHGMEE